MKILYIKDSTSDSQLIRRDEALNNDISITVFDEVIAGIKNLPIVKPDVIVSDFRDKSNITGLNLWAFLRKESAYKNIPFVITVDKKNLLLQQKAFDVNFGVLLVKPVAVVKLKEYSNYYDHHLSLDETLARLELFLIHTKITHDKYLITYYTDKMIDFYSNFLSNLNKTEALEHFYSNLKIITKKSFQYAA